MKRFIAVGLIAGMWPLAVMGQHKTQPYAGFQDRPISSLSESDISQLESGAGWGLALPAELNGYPGPRHILELQDELNLSTSQKAAIEVLSGAMQADAIAAGLKLIEAERALDDLFKNGDARSDTLSFAVQTAARARADLRFVHLSQHLKTVEILSSDQVEKYNQLRGYISDDKCQNIPEGHNHEMWRKQNGCDG